MKPNFKNVAAIILAAGEGTRFNFGKPSKTQKVLMEIDGRPMIDHTIDLLKKLNLGQIVIVVGHLGDAVKKHLGQKFAYATQVKRAGTADAAKCGLEKVDSSCNIILIVNGDDSFRYKPKTLIDILKKHYSSKTILTFVTVEKENPAGLGRVIRDNKGEVIEIVEEKEATPEQRKITEINNGIYVFNKNWLAKNISKIKKSSVTSEYYLVDLVKIAKTQGGRVETYKLTNPAEWFGVNTEEELAIANQ